VTSLAAAGVDPPDPGLFVVDLAEAFAGWLARWRGVGFEPVRQRWLQRAYPLGTPLATSAADGTRLEGLFDGLDPSGAVRLRLADGNVHVMHAGDIDLI
jgi:BirA family biotin operon repressor/biotin-[acetyl-CoA-carboxylase] ligase